MKIALLTPTFCKFSGIDRVVEQQAKGLSMEGHIVTIFTFEADLDLPQNVKLKVIGMPKWLLLQRVYRLLFPLDFITAIKWLPRLRGFDIIYSHYYPMNWLAYLAKKFFGVKYIYYNYGITPPTLFSNLIERSYMRLFTYAANWTIKRADTVISCSQYLQQQLKREMGIDSIVLYNKLDTSRFHPGLDGLRIRDKFKLGTHPVILYVGRISPHKGLDLLIEAFTLVRERLPSARLVIVGKHTFAHYSKLLRQRADNSVIFADYVPDEELPYYYAGCDIYATGTMWEGFNLPLVEAQASGKPVVAFNIGPHPEIVKDGETGFLVPPKDIRALSQAIIRLLEDGNLREEMSKKASRIIKERLA